MTISVTTRASKGSALSHTEMDTNFNSLARNATTTQQGNIEIATEAEAIALTSTTLAITPSVLQAVIEEVLENQAVSNIGQDGYYVIPGVDLYIQWGRGGSVAANSTSAKTFPTPFPNNLFTVVMTPETVFTTVNATGPVSIKDETTSGFTVNNGMSVTINETFFIAIGN